MTIYLGETVTLTITFTDADGVEANPDNNTVTVTVYDPAGTQKATQVIASADKRTGTTSTYDYHYDIPSSATAGVWKVKWEATTTVGSTTHETIDVWRFIVATP